MFGQELPIREAKGWRTPLAALMLMTGANAFAFAAWNALHTNFGVDAVGFRGEEMGILHTAREIPGFLSFAAVFLLLLMREQTLGVASLGFIGLGVAVTGFFPTALGFYATTVIMSLGFHYYETVNQSLALQWFDKRSAPHRLGLVNSAASVATIAAYGLIFVAWKWLALDYVWVFAAGGIAALLIAGFVTVAFPHFREEVPQRRRLVLRSRYWLYYAITFIGGARRQIFLIFAALLMVQKFGYDVSAVALIMLVNAVFNAFLAPALGRFIIAWGERRSTIIEHAGLVLVFAAYAVVSDPAIAAILFMLDNAFFSMSIAHKTYFQKIGDAADMAPTAGVAFSINHIAAIGLPVPLGLVWDAHYSWVFWIGTAIAFAGLLLSFLVPRNPSPGNEVAWPEAAPAVAEPAN